MFPAVQCDFGKTYQACQLPMQASCEIPNPDNGYGNTSSCIEGCFCPDGYVLHGNHSFWGGGCKYFGIYLSLLIDIGSCIVLCKSKTAGVNSSFPHRNLTRLTWLEFPRTLISISGAQNLTHKLSLYFLELNSRNYVRVSKKHIKNLEMNSPHQSLCQSLQELIISTSKAYNF